MDHPLQSIHELASGSLTIQVNENQNQTQTDNSGINVSLSFLRHSDGKLFELSINESKILDLHKIFETDASLILGILENQPSELNFISDNDLPPLYLHTEEHAHVIDQQDIKLEYVDIVWIFTQTVTLGSLKKSKDHHVPIRIPEKMHPPGSNQQIIELNRLLACYKQRVDDLEMSWTLRHNLEGQGQMIPKTDRIHRLAIDDMDWLSRSHYGKVMGLDKYYIQFKNTDDMANQLYPKISNEESSRLQSKYERGLYCHEKHNDNSGQHIQQWLLENNLQFDEIKSAEFHLNKWMEDSSCELVEIQTYNYSKIHIFIDHHRYSPNPSKLSHVSPGTLHGCVRAANPRKKKIYLIAKSTDPRPAKYEKAYYLKDAYQPIRDYVKTYSVISVIDEETEKHIQYNSQWVIYKICA
jgi:hypothetical protein